MHIHRHVGFTGNGWMKIGYDLWARPEFSFPRDFFIPLPNQALEGPSKHMAKYSDVSAMSRLILRELKRPVRCSITRRWEESDSYLILPPGHLFWSEHSERHFLPGATAALGYSRDDRDYLGRWGIDAQRSDDYVATSRQVVMRLQEGLCKAISSGTGGGRYDEDDVIREYGEFISRRLPEANTMEWLAGIEVLDRKGSLGQLWPLDEDTEVPAGANFEESEPVGGLVRVGTPKGLEADLTAPFWVSITKSGFRRLHRLDGCWVSPLECFDWRSSRVLEEGMADRPCLLCWPEARKGPVESSSGEEASTGSSSSDTDSEMESGRAPEDPWEDVS